MQGFSNFPFTMWDKLEELSEHQKDVLRRVLAYTQNPLTEAQAKVYIKLIKEVVTP